MLMHAFSSRGGGPRGAYNFQGGPKKIRNRARSIVRHLICMHRNCTIFSIPCLLRRAAHFIFGSKPEGLDSNFCCLYFVLTK